MKARKQLRDLLKILPQTVVGNAVGVSQQVVSKWCTKPRTPSAFHQAMLEASYDINRDGWLTPKQRQQVDRARQEKEDRTADAARAVLDRHGEAEQAEATSPTGGPKITSAPKTPKTRAPAEDGAARAASVKRKKRAAPARTRRPRRPRVEPLPPPVSTSLRFEPESDEAHA